MTSYTTPNGNVHANSQSRVQKQAKEVQMTWYAASIIIAFRTEQKDRSPILVHENVILIEAPNEDEAMKKAKTAGENQVQSDASEDLRVGNRPAHIDFIGVRKLITVSNPSPLSQDKDRPVDGTEVTYSQFELPDEDALMRLSNGDDVTLRYIE
jgi:Domain of unknown function (DUF4288)